MPRIRTIKPDFFFHEGLYELEEESGLPIRLSFISLWTICDREGRFKWRPRQLKAQCLPYDNIDFSRVLDALVTRGFLVKYTSQGGDFAYIPTFKEHQVINNRESESILPSPENPEEQTAEESQKLTRQPRVDHALTTPLDLAQAERKGKERNIKKYIKKDFEEWFEEIWKNYKPVKAKDGTEVSKGDKKPTLNKYLQLMSAAKEPLELHKKIKVGMDSYLQDCSKNQRYTKQLIKFLKDETWLSFENENIVEINSLAVIYDYAAQRDLGVLDNPEKFRRLERYEKENGKIDTEKTTREDFCKNATQTQNKNAV